MAVSSTALLACGALLLLYAADVTDCAEDFLRKVTESESVSKRKLVHSAAFTQQLRLLDPDASVEQLALTEEDVQFFGVTVDGCEFWRPASRMPLELLPLITAVTAIPGYAQQY